jgi:hypothetical protein
MQGLSFIILACLIYFSVVIAVILAIPQAQAGLIQGVNMLASYLHSQAVCLIGQVMVYLK